MVDGRFFIYAVALLILSAAAVLIAVRMLAARRTTRYESYDDDDDERPLTDIPLLFQPREVKPVYFPQPQQRAQPVAPPPPVARRPAPQPMRPTAPAPTPAPTQNGSSYRTPAEFTSPPAPVDEGPMQLLPGRLEPVNRGTQQEIRFVKVPGVTRFTFGRSPGPAYEHVQLRAATASRMHGYMAFEAGRWRIGNLSETNHVIVNGSPLMEEAGRLLEDGDQIEFGEVAFVFRER